MTSIDPAALPEDSAQSRELRLANLSRLITRCDPWFRALGLGFLSPVWRMLIGDNPRGQIADLWRLAGVPVLAIAGFLALWATLAPMVQTSLGAIPGPAQVWEQAQVLHADARAAGVKEAEFYARQADKNAELVAAGRGEDVKERVYTGRPTYYTQIFTSIKTVFAGFLIGTAIAVPPMRTTAFDSRGKPPLIWPTSVVVPPTSTTIASSRPERYAAPRIEFVAPEAKL